MSITEIRLPHASTYNFGIGIDRLSGTTKNLTVKPNPIPPSFAMGGDQSLEVSRISSTHDLQKSLGIDANASYGCATFGAGVSARFSFAENSQVHSSSLFMTVTASARCPDLSIAECVLTDPAGVAIDHPEVFTERYGDMFARACRRGGIFVGVMRVETFDEVTANTIESELRGTYGLFSADASMNFSKITSNHNATVYCSVYAEGGPPVHINDPTNPKELLDLANAWLQALHENPERYSKPYEWTFSPTSICEGPMPLSAAEYQHVQDVLMFCDTERATLLDQLHRMNWWVRHQDRYEWTDAASVDQIAAAATATQKDLETVSDCAVEAMNNPRRADMPAAFAASRGIQYPLSLPPPKGPRAIPVAARPAPVPPPPARPDFRHSPAVYRENFIIR